MSEQQAISSSIGALELIVAGGIGGAVASSIGNWFVNKKLQKQKAEYDKQLEFFKSKSDKKKTVHKLQFEKEFQLYGELWEALVGVRKTAVITPTLDTMPEDRSAYDVYKDRSATAANAFNKAMNLFENHRPFYHDDVSKITRDLLSQCRAYIRSVGRNLELGKLDVEFREKADELSEKVPEAIDEIEKAIKERIGLLQEAEIVE